MSSVCLGRDGLTTRKRFQHNRAISIEGDPGNVRYAHPYTKVTSSREGRSSRGEVWAAPLAGVRFARP